MKDEMDRFYRSPHRYTQSYPQKLGKKKSGKVGLVQDELAFFAAGADSELQFTVKIFLATTSVLRTVRSLACFN